MKNIKSFIDKKILERDIEFFLFVLFFIFMVGYYFLRIFKHSPWYDELYTYYYFISNGPVYSAIHWPVPNNHIGYSVLSGMVYELTHNAFLSLRGISFIAANANLIFIYIISKKLMGNCFALTSVTIYSATWLANNLSVQGRGYTLATTMMLLCMYSMLRVIYDDVVKERYYIFWTIGLFYGLYIVSSSLYWVIPICVCAGICLLVFRKINELIRLIIHSVVAAFITAFLYLTVWLAIGSNLLIKETVEFAGDSHVHLILSHPVKAAMRGIEYMLATPYIQSVSKTGYRLAFEQHWITLISQMFDATSIIMIGLFIAIISALVIIIDRYIFSRKADADIWITNPVMKNEFVVAITTLVMLVVTPLVVMLQVKLPYYRVFSFYCVIVAVALTFVLYVFFGRVKKSFTFAIPVLFVAFTIAQLLSADYNGSYGSREEAAYDLMTNNDLTVYDSVAITDCNQEYMYKFVYDVENANTDITNSEAVVIEKSMLDSNAEEAWEFYYTYDSLPIEDVQSRDIVYENDYYLLCVK